MFYSYQVNDYFNFVLCKNNNVDNGKKMITLISSAKSKYRCIIANIKNFESLLRFDYNIKVLLINTFYFGLKSYNVL